MHPEGLAERSEASFVSEDRLFIHHVHTHGMYVLIPYYHNGLFFLAVGSRSGIKKYNTIDKMPLVK